MEKALQSEKMKVHVMKEFFIETFGRMKAKLPRQELVKYFGEKELVEMEIALYAERKGV